MSRINVLVSVPLYDENDIRDEQDLLISPRCTLKDGIGLTLPDGSKFFVVASDLQRAISVCTTSYVNDDSDHLL